MIRIFYYIISFTIIIYGLLIGFAHVAEWKMHDKYGITYNEFRIKKGITPISEFDNTTEIKWADLLPEDKIYKWFWILTDEEIATETYFQNDSIKDRPYHHSKTVFYGTQLFFWKNYYGGEIDIFLNPISKDTTLKLFVGYHSANLKPGDFFYANLDTLYTNKPDIFICGTPFIDDDRNIQPIGNIEKEEADKLLENWNIKN